MKRLHHMLVRMYKLAVRDAAGRLYLPLFDYEWQHVTCYTRAEEAIELNTQLWMTDHPEEFPQ